MFKILKTLFFIFLVIICNSGCESHHEQSEIYFYNVWGVSSSDIYAVGDYGTIAHYDGSKWATMDGGGKNYLISVWGTNKSNIFVVDCLV